MLGPVRCNAFVFPQKPGIVNGSTPQGDGPRLSLAGTIPWICRVGIVPRNTLTEAIELHGNDVFITQCIVCFPPCTPTTIHDQPTESHLCEILHIGVSSSHTQARLIPHTSISIRAYVGVYDERSVYASRRRVAAVGSSNVC